jgi:beta-aspartyl-peptidase (threonine type)
VCLIGEGASRYAVECGMTRCGPERLWTPREQAVWERHDREHKAQAAAVLGDTVGAAALDANGHLAAAVSTGGQPYKRPGRVGDVPCAGAGYYADDTVGAAVSTGDGESIIRVLMAKGTLDRLAAGMAPQEAAEAAIADLAARTGGEGGIIVLDPQGRVGTACCTRRMGRAWGRVGGEICAAVEP